MDRGLRRTHDRTDCEARLMVASKFRRNDDSEGWIVRWFRKIEKELRELRAAKTLDAATIGNDGLKIKGNGGIQLIAPDGTVICEVLGDASNPDPDGNPQPMFRLYRN